MSRITLVLGGARSGKSSFVLNEGNLRKGKKAFIATAQALDEEMDTRIKHHKRERGDAWDTFEEPLDIAGVLSRIGREYDVTIIDCLTLWVSNVMHAEADDVEGEFLKLEAALRSNPNTDIYIVSNEVGMGIVPEYQLARSYRDFLGSLNKRIAAIADSVILMVAGLPLVLKKR